MAKLKGEALRNMTDAEIEQKLVTLKEELYKKRVESQTARVEKPHMSGLIKKDIARCLTIMRERKSGTK